MAYISWHVILQTSHEDTAREFVSRLEASLELLLEIRTLESYWKFENTYSVIFHTPLPISSNNPAAIVYEVLGRAHRLSDWWSIQIPEPGSILLEGIAARTVQPCGIREAWVEWAQFEVVENEEPNDVNEDD